MKRKTIFRPYPCLYLYLCLCLVTLPLACTRGRQPNVLMIVIDTLRPDRLGVYGSQRGLTPFMDSIAERGFVFRNAYAQASWTNASVASLLTSRYQAQHRITSFKSVLPDHEITLTEVLHEHGYATGGFSANFLVAPKLGFDQGFDQYRIYAPSKTDASGNTTYGKERAEQVNQAGLAWLDDVRKQRPPETPVYLYLQYMEPHNPYHPPDAYLEHVLAGRPRPDQEKANGYMRFSNLVEFSDDIVQAVKDLYDAEVMSVDAALRELFTNLQQRGFLDNAIVVILSDHGEEFQEHGLMGHHHTLFEEVIRVPLLMLVPGRRGGATIEAIVSLTDVAPTIFDLAHIPAPSSFGGISLRTLMGLSRPTDWWPFGGGNKTGREAHPNVAFSELIKEPEIREHPHERAVIKEKQKLVANADGGREYYDLHSDPRESNPQGIGDAQRAVLADALSQFEQQRPAHPGPKNTMAMDPETRERMRALGYTE